MIRKVFSTVKTESNRFIEILEWAYEKQEAGFLEEDLIKKFDLRPEKIKWYLMVFKPNQPGDRMIEYVEGEHIYAITAKGISTVIGYRKLKEAEKSGKLATRIAIVAIVIGIIVGVAQIVIDWNSLGH